MFFRIMFRVKLLFLVLILASTSGYRFRCYIFCNDQTGIQNDYIEVRDNCREYAQLKLDTGYKAPPGGDDKGKKAQLVSLFSECMAKNGWTVPDGKDKPSAAVLAKEAIKDEKSEAESLTEKYKQQAAITRSSECNFARQSAANSAVAASRAKACDLECAQRLRAAPDAPRPAACPSEHSPLLERGVDRE
ncbi:MAG: hypothetical protein SFT92_02725 [Rickettsiales bacterium]|nr:hypothetical protein [Rickettsiales bacterium]